MTLDSPIARTVFDATAQIAPFQSSVAQAPVGAHAEWVHAEDGVRLRVGVMGRGQRGTILFLQGRTEYLEKYGIVASEFAQRGFGSVAVDLRGQGHSDHFVEDRRIGHVEKFSDYQLDVDALVRFAEARSMPKPWFLLGHSLGGAVGLRALMNGLDVKAAAFSAPMWGIEMPRLLRPVAWSLGWLAHRIKFNKWVAPGMALDAYPLSVTVEDNLLTSDPDMLDYIQRQLLLDSDLQLGGPSVPWLYRALRECHDLQKNAFIEIPTITFLPTDEEIVSKAPMRLFAARWPNSKLIEVEGGRHETMMETPERREAFYDKTVSFFENAP